MSSFFGFLGRDLIGPIHWERDVSITFVMKVLCKWQKLNPFMQCFSLTEKFNPFLTLNSSQNDIVKSGKDEVLKFSARNYLILPAWRKRKYAVDEMVGWPRQVQRDNSWPMFQTQRICTGWRNPTSLVFTFLATRLFSCWLLSCEGCWWKSALFICHGQGLVGSKQRDFHNQT